MNEKLREVLADEAFVKSCIEAENEEAVQKLLADKGVEMSLTEIELMKEMFSAVADGKITGEQLEQLSKAGELSEEELEEAAGGGSHFYLFEDTIFEISNRFVNDVEQIKVGAGAYRLGQVGVAAAAIGAVALAGYGVYDAIRRRW
ncbi:MAG: hypothetical protein IKN55_10890 [Oscillospiraceae bacterium]|nr:hypothetical protein [Oscillospiraceae bacterium]